MKPRTTFLVIALIVVLVTAGIFVGRLFLPQSKAQQSSYPEGSIRAQVQQARSRGDTSMSVVVELNYPAPNDISEALATSSLIVGQLAAVSTSWDDATGEITTWYKFNTVETLVQRAYEPCENCTTPVVPSDLQPVNAGQVVVALSGGAAVIDDVAVEELLPDFSGMVIGQRYLLFVNFDPATNIGGLDYGPAGALLVNSQNTFTPVIESLEDQSDEISTGLIAQYGNSLNQLRAALNPTTCNQTERQSCIDDGGTWNDNNCTCQPAFDPCIHKPWLCE